MPYICKSKKQQKMAFFMQKDHEKQLFYKLDEFDHTDLVSMSKCDHEFAEIFQKLRILGGTILNLVPSLILEYLTVSTEGPDPIFQNFLMKINE